MIFRRFLRMHRFCFLKNVWIIFSHFMAKIRRILFSRQRPTVNKKSSPEIVFRSFAFCTPSMLLRDATLMHKFAGYREKKRKSWDCLVIDVLWYSAITNFIYEYLFLSLDTCHDHGWRHVSFWWLQTISQRRTIIHDRMVFARSRLVMSRHEGDADDMSDARPPFSLITPR